MSGRIAHDRNRRRAWKRAQLAAEFRDAGRTLEERVADVVHEVCFRGAQRAWIAEAERAMRVGCAGAILCAAPLAQSYRLRAARREAWERYASTSFWARHSDPETWRFFPIGFPGRRGWSS